MNKLKKKLCMAIIKRSEILHMGILLGLTQGKIKIKFWHVLGEW